MMRSEPAPTRERYNEDNSDAENDVDDGVKPDREEGEWTPGSQQSDLKFPERRCSEQKTRHNHSLVREDRKRNRNDREDDPVDNRRGDFYRSPLYNRNKKSRQESSPRHAAMGKRDKKSTNSWGQDSNRSGSREIEQPRFTRRDLIRFVKERNGSIHRTTCALTLTLDSRDAASKLYKLLQSRGYSGVWLSLTLKWMWDRQDMEELVEAIENSKLQTLVFNGTDPGGHRFGDSTTAQGHGNRSRCDPLVRLLGVKSLKELHLVGVPDILRASFANIPADLSHLSKLQIRHEIASNWENAHGARFYEAMKKATRLWTLVLDCPPSRTREYMEQIRNAIRNSSRANALANNARKRQPLPPQDEYMSQVLPAPSPPPYLDVHFNDQGKSFLTARFDRISGDVFEYSLDLEQIERPQETRWTSFFLSEMALTLTALRLRHLRDDNWVLIILEWIKQHHKANRIQFKELTINCHQLSPERFLDFCSLVKESQSTLLALELTDFNPSLPQQTEHIYSENAIARGWSSFFKSLDLLVLNTLYIQRSNFGDIAVQPLIDTLEDAKYQSHQLALSKLLLFHTRVSDYGVELLRQAIDGTRCRLQV
ncbi:hypothetical protein BGZ50_004854 [Haplosporangium sp. Z 11]|nr:hypothetical protein BGZ50_004854 [Haplosporangium sp. Z 11]